MRQHRLDKRLIFLASVLLPLLAAGPSIEGTADADLWQKRLYERYAMPAGAGSAAALPTQRAASDAGCADGAGCFTRSTPLNAGKGFPAPDTASLTDRITGAEAFLSGLYASDGSTAYVKEYLGTPFSLRANPGSTCDASVYPIQVGEYDGSPKVGKGQLVWVVRQESSTDWDYTVFAFLDNPRIRHAAADYGSPTVELYRTYHADGSTIWRIAVLADTPAGKTQMTSCDASLYLGDDLILDNLNTPGRTSYNVSFTRQRSDPPYQSFRYMLRGTATMAVPMYEALGEDARSVQLASSVKQYENNRSTMLDNWTPMWGVIEPGDGAREDYVYLPEVFWDCPFYVQGKGVQSPFSRGYSPYRYSYESRVCSFSGLDRGMVGPRLYQQTARLDPLSWLQQAVDVLNKTGNPHTQYPDPAAVIGTPSSVSPLRIAERVGSDWWNGYGVYKWSPSCLAGHSRCADTSYASGIRTAYLLVLDTLLGYGYGATSPYDHDTDVLARRADADTLASILTQVQWGHGPNPQDWGQSQAGGGLLLRPQFNGAPYSSWTTIGTGYAYAVPGNGLAGQLQDLVVTPMPPEGPSDQVSNAETTLAYMQALRIYEYYKYGIAVTGNLLSMPRTAAASVAAPNTVSLDTDPSRPLR